MKQLFQLLLALMLFTSCSGQTKNNTPGNRSATKTSMLPKAHNAFTTASVGCGMQDKEDNIWFGTNGEGLFYYDGKTFTNFTQKDGLDNNIVYSILGDSAGNIWVGTQTGLNRYNGKNFTNIPITLTTAPSPFLDHINSNNPPLQNGVWAIMRDKKGMIWFGTDAGLYCYNGRYFTRFLDDAGISNKDSQQLKAVFTILEDRSGNMWFGTCATEGISRYDGRSLTKVATEKEVGRVNRIVEDNNGALWFATTRSYLCRCDGKTFVKNVFNKKDGDKDLILKDKFGHIWFDTREGLGCYDGKNLKILTEKDGLPDRKTYPVLEDKQSNIWFAADGMRLYKWNGKTFTKFSE